MKKNIDECGIRNGEMIENKRIKIGIISDTHGLLRTEVLDILQSCDCIFHAPFFFLSLVSIDFLII